MAGSRFLPSPPPDTTQHTHTRTHQAGRHDGQTDRQTDTPTPHCTTLIKHLHRSINLHLPPPTLWGQGSLSVGVPVRSVRSAVALTSSNERPRHRRPEHLPNPPLGRRHHPALRREHHHQPAGEDDGIRQLGVAHPPARQPQHPLAESRLADAHVATGVEHVGREGQGHVGLPDRPLVAVVGCQECLAQDGVGEAPIAVPVADRRGRVGRITGAAEVQRHGHGGAAAASTHGVGHLALGRLLQAERPPGGQVRADEHVLRDGLGMVLELAESRRDDVLPRQLDGDTGDGLEVCRRAHHRLPPPPVAISLLKHPDQSEKRTGVAAQLVVGEEQRCAGSAEGLVESGREEAGVDEDGEGSGGTAQCWEGFYWSQLCDDSADVIRKRLHLSMRVCGWLVGYCV
mmetsp:Transcript_27165/g.78116  ORF Transcript_27165/g.78116 Transcript_27165/m.78116 type:complete len:400 (-) Transcript_27165:10-1209(-)